jgi:flagellar basal body-associated protein FliL
MSFVNSKSRKIIWLNWLLLLLLLVTNSLTMTACVTLHGKDKSDKENVKDKSDKGDKKQEGNKSKHQAKPQPTSADDKYKGDGEDKIDDDDPE